jgi:hypothetical protein
MNRVESASLQASSDHTSAHPHSRQLMSSHNPVLRIRQLGKHAIDVIVATIQSARPTFCS